MTERINTLHLFDVNNEILPEVLIDFDIIFERYRRDKRLNIDIGIPQQWTLQYNDVELIIERPCRDERGEQCGRTRVHLPRALFAMFVFDTGVAA
jgi:hypothetical protein